MQAILEKNQIMESDARPINEDFGRKIGLLNKIFGCWHKDLSRPFTIGNASYCACLHCGARQHFDAEILKTYGSFHYPPTISLIK